MPPKTLKMPEEERRFTQGTIIATASAEAIGFDDLIDQLSHAAVVFVGERHTSREDHEIQLRILTALVDRGARVKVGMEMFDHTYQPVLDQWSAGQLDTQRFLELTHWYANWRYDYDLYRPILDYVQQKRLPLVGLNLPFNLPPKIAIGGLDSLRPAERALIAADIDTGDAEHRAYLRRIFDQHHLKGRDNFEYFYMAQCAWEDTMAAQIAAHLDDGDLMVVIIGNGHIQKRYAGGEADRSDADFIWVTAPLPSHHMPKMK
ncbi:MAG: ChaN family lipoprotein [Desulfosarcinaceae bacterium]